MRKKIRRKKKFLLKLKQFCKRSKVKKGCVCPLMYTTPTRETLRFQEMEKNIECEKCVGWLKVFARERSSRVVSIKAKMRFFLFNSAINDSKLRYKKKREILLCKERKFLWHYLQNFTSEKLLKKAREWRDEIEAEVYLLYGVGRLPKSGSCNSGCRPFIKSLAAFTTRVNVFCVLCELSKWFSVKKRHNQARERLSRKLLARQRTTFYL